MRRLNDEIRTIHRHGNMQVLRHHIYEYQKGLRNLILHTASACLEKDIISFLEKKDITYHIQRTSDKKINVFFGEKRCIGVLKEIGEKSLSDYTPEEDFILGTMLGYDRLQQCDRYLRKKSRKSASNSSLISGFRKSAAITACTQNCF